jgi:hypothetical protein
VWPRGRAWGEGGAWYATSLFDVIKAVLPPKELGVAVITLTRDHFKGGCTKDPKRSGARCALKERGFGFLLLPRTRLKAREGASLL